MKQVFILLSCDAWHSRWSKVNQGVFSTKEKLMKYAKTFLDSDDLNDLKEFNQTQGKDTNYSIDTYTLNERLNEKS